MSKSSKQQARAAGAAASARADEVETRKKPRATCVDFASSGGYSGLIPMCYKHALKKTGVAAILMGLSATIFSVMMCGCEKPKNVVIGLESPLSVKNGEEFEVVATVKNTSARRQTLVSLDIADEWLDGIAILRTEPDYSDASHIPVDNTVSYVFEITIEGGGTAEVKLHAKAIKNGDHRAEIDFCINSGVSFLSKPIRTIVEQ